MSQLERLPRLGDGGVKLSPVASIQFDYSGAVIVAQEGARKRPATLVDLEVLLRLADGPAGPNELIQAVAVSANVDRGEVEQALDDIDDRRLLLPGGAKPRLFEAPAPTSRLNVDRPTEDELIVLATPTVLRPTPEGFVALDYLGRLTALLTPGEVLLAAVFAKATTLTQGQKAAAELTTGPDHRAFEALVSDLLSVNLLRVVDSDPNDERTGRAKDQMRAAIQYKRRLRRAVDKDLASLDIREAALEAQTGIRRTPVIPVHDNGQFLPLGLGMILSMLQTRSAGPIAQWFQVRPDWVAGSRDISELAVRPAVYLFSNYLWSHGSNLARSKAVKSASPTSLTIHGGPDTPKHRDDVVDYFDANRHVDIAVHGEGECTVGDILDALGGSVGESGPTDLSVLLEVPGISFRHEGTVVHTAKRERLADLNVVPSPFLTGLFDAYRGLPGLSVILETNRGCPYGCTFCDWGTVTNARIRKFDMDRVLAELEWSASAGAQGLALADANFGIFKRDVEIASRIVELHKVHASPIGCSASYAKNTVKHLEQIISLWVGAGILTKGVLSLQTLDDDTLDAVHRSNIKTEKYDLLARQFCELDLPLYIDLMMGLPGATLDSFVDDLQSCIAREVQAKIHETVLLPNSPMNEPSYRLEHSLQIRRRGPIGSTDRDPTIVSTSSMSEDDMARAVSLKKLFLLGENFGVLRHLSRHLRHETGVREIDLYQHLLDVVEARPEQWPALDFVDRTFSMSMLPPISWPLLVQEVREVLVEFGVADNDALQTVVDVQVAVLPAVGRPRCITLELPHDYARWHGQMIQAKLDAADWTSVVPPLGTFPPGTLEADDPLSISEMALGAPLVGAWFDSWELESPVARASIFNRRLIETLTERAS